MLTRAPLSGSPSLQATLVFFAISIFLAVTALLAGRSVGHWLAFTLFAVCSLTFAERLYRFLRASSDARKAG